MRRGRLITKIKGKLTRGSTSKVIAEGLLKAKIPITNPELTGPLSPMVAESGL
jgi:hypothetical protein